MSAARVGAFVLDPNRTKWRQYSKEETDRMTKAQQNQLCDFQPQILSDDVVRSRCVLVRLSVCSVSLFCLPRLFF
jgi:hypothetical protein